MAKTDYQSVDEYIGTFPDDVQANLMQVRKAIRSAVPDAEEVISYQIPAYRHHGFVMYFSAYKKHIAITCPPPFTVFEAFADQLASYKKSKTTVQLPLNQPMPTQLIHDLAAFRAKENEERTS